MYILCSVYFTISLKENIYIYNLSSYDYRHDDVMPMFDLEYFPVQSCTMKIGFYFFVLFSKMRARLIKYESGKLYYAVMGKRMKYSKIKSKH